MCIFSPLNCVGIINYSYNVNLWSSKQKKIRFKVSFGVVKWFTGYRKTFYSSNCFKSYEVSHDLKQLVNGSQLEVLDDLFAFERPKILPTVFIKKKQRDYFWRIRMICWLSNNLGAGREKVEASDLQFFQLWDLFSKCFSSEILIERYTRKWKFLHLTKGKSQGVKCQSSQGLLNKSFFGSHPSKSS